MSLISSCIMSTDSSDPRADCLALVLLEPDEVSWESTYNTLNDVTASQRSWQNEINTERPDFNAEHAEARRPHAGIDIDTEHAEARSPHAASSTEARSWVATNTHAEARSRHADTIAEYAEARSRHATINNEARSCLAAIEISAEARSQPAATNTAHAEARSRHAAISTKHVEAAQSRHSDIITAHMEARSRHTRSRGPYVLSGGSLEAEIVYFTISPTAISSRILAHVHTQIHRLRSKYGGDELCIFKIGISACIETRWEHYKLQNFAIMAVVLVSDSLIQIETLESAVIERYRGMRQCRNQQGGGEGMRKRLGEPRREPPYYLYVVAVRADSPLAIGS